MQCYLWVYYSTKWAALFNGKERVSIVDQRWKTDKRCKSENPLPTAAVSQEQRGARPAIANPRRQRRNVPSQENSGQASGDRLHFAGVQALGIQSHEVPE